MTRRKRGAPRGNTNAAKAEHKQYDRIFGQRWEKPVGLIIKQGLAARGQKEKEYLNEVVERDFIMTDRTSIYAPHVIIDGGEYPVSMMIFDKNGKVSRLTTKPETVGGEFYEIEHEDIDNISIIWKERTNADTD